MGKEIVLRHLLAVLFGCICITVMTSSFNSAFDKVASTSLFGCIMSVANEDDSLGPVIHKGANRFSGALVGGLCGLLCIVLRDALPPLPHPVLLIVVPCVFIFLLQSLTESDYMSANFVKKYKMKHFVVQLQVAFGVVYIGDTVNEERDGNYLMVATARTCAILAGVLCLLLASLLAFPETSLQASTSNLSESLRLLGKLSVKITGHRIQGRTLPRYDHRQILFATDPVMDGQVSLLVLVDRKLARVTALLPHLWLEPSWVPGLPIQLFSAQPHLASHWTPFLTVMVSRLRRIRSTLSAMDSNMRLSSEEADKELTESIAEKMTQLVSSVEEGMSLVGTYVVSPYHPSSEEGKPDSSTLWKGDLSVRDRLKEVHIRVQTSIEQFALAFEDSIQHNHMMLPHPHLDPDDPAQIQAKVYSKADMTHNKFHVNTYTTSPTAPHRVHLGHTLDYYFKTGPRRTFCNLCIQVAIQTTSLIMEAVDFMDSLDPHSGTGSKTDSPVERPALVRQGSEEETAYKPLRAKSGLRLAEEVAGAQERSGAT